MHVDDERDLMPPERDDSENQIVPPNGRNSLGDADLVRTGEQPLNDDKTIERDASDE